MRYDLIKPFVAARLGDAHVVDALAFKTLENGMWKYPSAPNAELARALLYRSELAVRLKKNKLARESLQAAKDVSLSANVRKSLGDDIIQTEKLVEEL